MLQSQQIEAFLAAVATFDRENLKGRFQSFHGSFPIDLTPEFLDQTPIERLRHIFVALCLQTRQIPDIPAA